MLLRISYVSIFVKECSLDCFIVVWYEIQWLYHLNSLNIRKPDLSPIGICKRIVFQWHRRILFQYIIQKNSVCRTTSINCTPIGRIGICLCRYILTIKNIFDTIVYSVLLNHLHESMILRYI